MEDDLIESLGPILYAGYRGLLKYKEAYSEAVASYKNLTGNELVQDKEMLSKIISLAIAEVEKIPELSAKDFLKKYQQASLLFSMAKKFLR